MPARPTRSLAPHLLEEPYEALEALESGDDAGLLRGTRRRAAAGGVPRPGRGRARDGTGYTIDDVADGIVAKLVRRHPHVFADVTVSGADEVTRNWDEIKTGKRRRLKAERAGLPRRRRRLAVRA